jgi:PAS domain S-box-containing protein
LQYKSTSIPPDLKKIKVQLSWNHQFSYAGFYAAKEQGYYKEVGLEIELIENNTIKGPDNLPLKSYDVVLDGLADVGVDNPDIAVLRYLGKDPVILAPIFQHSPISFLTLKSSGIENVHQLHEKRIVMDTLAADMVSFMLEEGFSPRECKIKGYNDNIQNLIDGKVDAITVYSINEPFLFQEKGIPYNIISPLSSGIDFYGDLLFSTSKYVKTNPELIDKFLKATFKGWKYAMSHTDEMIDLVYLKYSQKYSKEHLKFQANQLQRFILSDVIELGYNNYIRWEKIIEVYKKTGIIGENFNTEGLFLRDYLEKEFEVNWTFIIIISLFVIISSIIILIFLRLLFKLRKEVANQKITNQKLAESENENNLLTENIQDVVWILDPDNLKITFISPSVYSLTGFTPEEIIDKPIELSFTNDGVNTIKSIIRSKMINYNQADNDYYIEMIEQPCKDGSAIWTEVVGKLFIDRKDNKFKFLGVSRDISQRLQSELELNKLFRATDESPIGIFITDNNGNIEYVNNKYCEITGYKKYELIGKSPKIMKSGKQNVEFYSDLWNTIINGNEWRGEFINKKKDGSHYIESAIITPIIDENNKITHFISIKEDITESRRIQQALIESENRLQIMIETSPDGIVTTSYDGIITTASQQFHLMLGYENQSELIGKSLLDFISINDINKVISHFNSVLSTESNSPIDCILIKKDGTNFYAGIKSNLMADKRIESNGIISIIRDISQKKMLEFDSQRFSNRLNSIIHTSPDGITTTNLDGLVISASKQAIRMFNYDSEDELINKSFFDLIHPDYHEMANYIHGEILQGVSYGSSEYMAIKKDGTLFFIEINVTLLPDEFGNPTQILLITRDITERKYAEEALKEGIQQKNHLIKELEKTSNQLTHTIATKDKFFSIIAHDLKNPLGNYRALANMLYESYQEYTDDERLELIEIIRASSENIYQLLENLLDWARAQKGQIKYIPDNFDISFAVNLTINVLLLSAQNKNITLVNEIPPGTFIIADVNLLTTVLRNLISNAIKFTNENGNINVSAIINEFDTIIAVKDDGCGMNSNTIDKLFRIDTNFSTLGTKKESGTGLGLILCKEFLDLHNGQIWAESDGENGSTIYFTIPNILKLKQVNL